MSNFNQEPPPAYNAANYSTPADYSSPLAPASYQDPGKGYGPAPAYSTQSYGPAQPYGGPQPIGAPQPGQTIVVNQPTVTLVQTFRESPVRTRCNHCGSEIVTGIHYETGTFTWIICIVLWLVGCGVGCCLIPFCVDSCKDVIHSCPNCHQMVARFNRM